MSDLYSSAGVNYDLIDPFKIAAQCAARETENNISDTTFTPVTWTRGESVFLYESQGRFFAHVEETLGTKNLIADAMYEITGKSYYDQIAQDTVATITNDLISLGARPLSISMHLAAGKSEWFQDQKRVEDLVRGWKEACDLSGAVWGGGETPTLAGIVESETVLLSGSGFGVIEDAKNLIQGNIADGDAIVVVESAGIHTNGLSLARKIARESQDGYEACLPDGRMFGEALLDASYIYADIFREAQKHGIEFHYTSHLTGHGWRKLMRHAGNFSYQIDRLPPVPPVFEYIQSAANLSDRQMYETFNMGGGYAFILQEKHVQTLIESIAECGKKAWKVGNVIASQEKSVYLKPHDIVFAAEELAVR